MSIKKPSRLFQGPWDDIAIPGLMSRKDRDATTCIPEGYAHCPARILRVIPIPKILILGTTIPWPT